MKWNVRMGLTAVFAYVFLNVCSCLVLIPLHERGQAQPLLRGLILLEQGIGLPGHILTSKLGLNRWGRNRRVAWFVTLGVNACWILGTVAWFTSKRSGAVEMGEPEDPSRRSFLKKLGLATGGVATMGVAYSVFVEPQWVGVSRHRFAVRGLPLSLEGLKVVQLSDLHLGPWSSEAYIASVIDRTNALEPDLVLLTGDYVHRSPSYILPVMNQLARLRARIGVVGVLGNHDWWEDGERTKRGFARVGLPLVDNARLFVSEERKLVQSPTNGLVIAGVGDLWTDCVDFNSALGGLPPDVPRLLLSHNPDVAENPLLAGHRVDLMLSGHTHGGQVYIPGMGTPILPSKFGQKYAQGFVDGPHCRVFVSRGVGVTVLPIRVGVPPEVVELELFRAS